MAKALAKLDIRTLRDLISWFPRRYEDRTETRRVADLVPGEVNLTRSEVIYPGGKGINVSKVISKLGGSSVATGILGGDTGNAIRSSLEAMGLENRFRFVKGETDYLCAGYPFEWFMPEYVSRGSRVVEQDLNLTPEEAHRLLALLQTEALPQNRRYRYNYVKDNCATRILDRIDDAYDDVRVIYPDSVTYGTFRNEMRAYNRNYPWYQFGIDLALGSGIDYGVTGREEMFVPVEMMQRAGAARLSDGRRLVKATRVLNEGDGDVTLGPTPFWLSPLAVAWILFVLTIVFAAYSLKTNRIIKWVYSLWFTLLGLTGTLTAFLVFISSHEATSPNMLLIWLNPLQLVIGLCVWWRTLRPAAVAMAYCDIVALICMLLVWPFMQQSGNPAIFPLIGITLILSATYAIIIHKDSYNNNGRSSSTVRTPATRKGRSARGITIKKKS